MRRKTVFLPKKTWQDFLEGREKTLKTFDGLELRKLFDDFDDVPEGRFVKVEISEVSIDNTPTSGGVPFNP